MQNLTFEVDADGIALITFDMPGRSMNVLNEGSMADYSTAVEKVLADPSIRGAVVTSGKQSFIAGADLEWILSLASADLPGPQRAVNVYNTAMVLQNILRRTENGGKPFVAAINGLALGGGLELCLACAHRVVADDPKIQLGLPEAKVGLLPGGGGTQRLSRMLGPLKALPLLLEGSSLVPAEALKIGIVDEVVPADQLVQRARSWILEAGEQDWVKAWDRKGFKAPGDDPRTLEGSLAFAASNALQRKRTFGNLPNLDAIQKAVYDGLNVPIDTGLRIETRQFASLMVSDVARNMVRTQFINLQKLNKLAARPKEVPVRKIARLGLLGADEQIAQLAAKAGIEVVTVGSNHPVDVDLVIATKPGGDAKTVCMHFFSAAGPTPLVEVIRSAGTTDAAIAGAMDLARHLRKTPIVVNGPYASRVLGTYMDEGHRMLMEGISPALIENAGRLAGMPVGPLALSDEVGLDRLPATSLLKRMVEKDKRMGRKQGRGFYDYPAEGPTRLWRGLDHIAERAAEQPDVEEVKLRLLTVQALEAVRCLEEGIVLSPEDADVAAWLGWGFAPWTGGPISYVDTVGVQRFVTTCRRLAEAQGERFAPTAGLIAKAEADETYYGTARGGKMVA